MTARGRNGGGSSLGVKGHRPACGKMPKIEAERGGVILLT